MRQYTYTILTRRQIAELMFISVKLPEEFLERCIEKTMLLDNIKFLNEAKKSTDLDIIQNGDKFKVRYGEYDISEILSLEEIKKRLNEFVW